MAGAVAGPHVWAMEPHFPAWPGFWVATAVGWLLVAIPMWRIFGRAGFRPWWALLTLLGPLGVLAALALLALWRWPADPLPGEAP